MDVAKISTIEAARIICMVLSNNHTIKSVLYSNDFQTDKRAIYAVVCKTLDSIDVLFKLAELFSSKLEKEHIDSFCAIPCTTCIFLVSCYEALNAKNRNLHLKVITKLTGDVFAFKTIKEKYKSLKEKVKQNDQHSGPIYLRINYFITTKEAVLAQLSERYTLVTYEPTLAYEGYIELIKQMKKDDFTVDFHLPDHLIVFGRGSQLYLDALVKSKDLLFQDKASCIPPMVLLEDDPKTVGDVIDCCAAPGNKTSFLGHLMSKMDSSKKKRTLYAFDRNPKRFSLLQKNLASLNMTDAQCSFNLCLENEDFIALEPGEKRFANITHIMVDPSCSGSGLSISKRGANSEEKNIKSLNCFQVKILLHCFKFPSVKSVVYSTCSIYEEENEKVVEQVLSEVNGDFTLANIWSKKNSIKWTSRGINQKQSIRTSSEKDATNGFFVAKFIRKTK